MYKGQACVHSRKENHTEYIQRDGLTSLAWRLAPTYCQGLFQPRPSVGPPGISPSLRRWCTRSGPPSTQSIYTQAEEQQHHTSVPTSLTTDMCIKTVSCYAVYRVIFALSYFFSVLLSNGFAQS